jgi:DNA adenine methylase
MNCIPTRPVLRWYGGKWKLAPKIIPYFPPHRTYVEPFGGAASVLLRKPRSYAEVYNDLDGEVVNLFRVLRDDASSDRLIRQLKLTPFARDEWKACYEPCQEPVERARRLVAISYMGFGSNAQSGYPTGFRANSNRSGTTPAQDWRNYPDCLAVIVDRLRGVIVENRDAMEVALRHDGQDTLHYFDPPYVMDTRWNGDPTGRERRGYKHELTDQDHIDLLKALHELRGGVVLSGYDHPIYTDALKHWRRIEIPAYADGARKRTELLWINPKACARLNQPSLLLTMGAVE